VQRERERETTVGDNLKSPQPPFPCISETAVSDKFDYSSAMRRASRRLVHSSRRDSSFSKVAFAWNKLPVRDARTSQSALLRDSEIANDTCAVAHVMCLCNSRNKRCVMRDSRVKFAS